MLKQCIENNIDLILIDDKYAIEYKKALYKAQKETDFTDLSDVFHECQELLDQKLTFLKDTLDYMKEDIQDNTQSM